jgi:hypothetical protein
MWFYVRGGQLILPEGQNRPEAAERRNICTCLNRDVAVDCLHRVQTRVLWRAAVCAVLDREVPCLAELNDYQLPKKQLAPCSLLSLENGALTSNCSHQQIIYFIDIDICCSSL